MERWIPKYETLSRLGGSSLFLIGNRLKRFLEEAGRIRPVTWPVNCFWLADLLSADRSGSVRLDVTETRAFSPDFEAATVYDPEEDRYLIIKRETPPDWESRSAYRRCNFTLAHELGHIFLGHLTIPDGRKPAAWRAREDAEADEFASRLLMPEELMRSARFPSLRAMAAAFLVSESACFHRMNNLRLLDRLRLPPPACPACGSRKISPCASWCRMCGASLGTRIPERTAAMLRLPRPSACPVCGSGVLPGPEGECPDCGQARDNPCLAEYDQPRHPNPPDARFCETCGAETLYAELSRTPFVTRDMPLRKLFPFPPAE